MAHWGRCNGSIGDMMAQGNIQWLIQICSGSWDRQRGLLRDVMAQLEYAVAHGFDVMAHLET